MSPKLKSVGKISTAFSNSAQSNYFKPAETFTAPECVLSNVIFPVCSLSYSLIKKIHDLSINFQFGKH